MGNNVSKKPYNRKLVSSSMSITIPSICEQESYIFPIAKQEDEASAEDEFLFSFERMQTVFLEHSFNYKGLEPIMTRSIIKGAITAFHQLRKHMKAFCLELHNDTLKFPECLKSRFESLPERSLPTREWIILQVATVILTHIKILYMYRDGKTQAAINFLQQVAVSHALINIPPSDFKILDMYLVHYLILNQLISDECIDYTISYLTIVTKHITDYYEVQTMKNETIVQELCIEEPNHRFNKARENYRLLDKWERFLVDVRRERSEIEDLYVRPALESKLAEENEDNATIDTLILKERDCIMKHFVKKRDKPPIKETN